MDPASVHLFDNNCYWKLHRLQTSDVRFIGWNGHFILNHSRRRLDGERAAIQHFIHYLYQCNNRKNSGDNKDETPIVMKKILKYPYVVNRYNTLIKEEKRRKKEEEMKQINQMNKNSINNDNNENNFINHE